MIVQIFRHTSIVIKADGDMSAQVPPTIPRLTKNCGVNPGATRSPLHRKIVGPFPFAHPVRKAVIDSRESSRFFWCFLMAASPIISSLPSFAIAHVSSQFQINHSTTCRNISRIAGLNSPASSAEFSSISCLYMLSVNWCHLPHSIRVSCGTHARVRYSHLYC